MQENAALPEGLLAVEVADNILRVLGDIEELLLLGYLGVLAVSLLLPFLLLLLRLFHRLCAENCLSQLTTTHVLILF